MSEEIKELEKEIFQEQCNIDALKRYIEHLKKQSEEKDEKTINELRKWADFRCSNRYDNTKKQILELEKKIDNNRIGYDVKMWKRIEKLEEKLAKLQEKSVE